MATHKFGKLRINTSDEGFAFRIGEGKVHRLGFGKKAQDEGAEYDENTYLEEEAYDDYDSDVGAASDAGVSGYSGRFSQPEADAYDDDGYEDEYEEYDDGEYDDGYADSYDDGEYDDGQYDDGQYDDGQYDDGQYDDGYDSGSYDDRYSDEDAQDEYDGAYTEEGGLMRYVDENDWVNYLLLFVFPPLGIYLLWRRRRFEKPLRWAVSIASAIWFLILLFLIISAIRSGSNDKTVSGPITITTPTPTVAAMATFTAVDANGNVVAAGTQQGTVDLSGDVVIGGASSGSDTSLLDSLAPDATAIPSGANMNVSDGGEDAAGNASVNSTATVYMTATGQYYHQIATCNGIETGALVSTVTENVAIARGKAACPICFQNQTMVWATDTGKYYHSTANCSDMKGAAQLTEAAAKAAGKTACPVCISHEINSLGTGGLKFAGSSTEDKSGITVYATKEGKNFHTNANCSGMTGATSGSLLKAMLAGKTACPTCCPTAGKIVYCTRGGTYYHTTNNCSDMVGAQPVTLAEAMVLGKKRCSKCVNGTTTGTDNSKLDSLTSGGNVYVYGTKDGKYYHTSSTCSGMKGATRYTLKSMILAGRKACPTCCSGSNSTVYAAEGGKYYHSYATCSDMKNAKAGTLAEALAYGYKKCPDCWKSSSSSAKTPNEEMVYCTKTGTYYHTRKNCSGMKDASKVAISAAVKAGKKACPTCASAASRKVYSTKTGKYYHSYATCSGMSGATARTIEEAKTMGQSPCPTCIGKSKTDSKTDAKKEESLKTISRDEFVKQAKKSNLTSSGKYKSGESGVKVYATVNGKYYHTTASCAGNGAAKITLETALNYGKTCCSKCASSANDKVYAAPGSKYYHYSKSCAGSGAVSGVRSVALAKGAEPCPYCVTKTKSIAKSSGTYKSGKSGIKVYASLTGKYYHTSKSCAGVNASTITLETALNYGKAACPNCSGSARKTVYATKSGKYYHSTKSCAGSGSTSGSFAKALASGLKPCPVCVNGSEAYEASDVKYAAEADTTVYIDLNNLDMPYYHRTKKCSNASMKKGQGVKLDFVIKWNYKACPYCTPPTSIL